MFSTEAPPIRTRIQQVSLACTMYRAIQYPRVATYVAAFFFLIQINLFFAPFR